MNWRRQQREDVQRLRKDVEDWLSKGLLEDNGIWMMRTIDALLKRQDELEERIEEMKSFTPVHHDPTGIFAHEHRVLCDVRKHWHPPWCTIGFYFTIAERWGRRAIDWSWFVTRRGAR
jgi:hypothetical protein